MAVNPTRKRILKIITIFLSILIVLLIGFHFWFKEHAKQMLEDLVETKSNGKLKMKVSKFKFGYFSRNMELVKVSFYNTDTIDANTSYRFDVKKINLRVKGLMAIIFQDQFLIDTLSLTEPNIQVTRLKRSDKKNKAGYSDVSIPEEMGRIYQSIQDALTVLKVSKFSIKNGKFTLINKIQENQQPVTINNLDLQVENLLIDTSLNSNKDKILFSDNVILSTHHQDITLPDSRHKISFKYFKINLKNKKVEFDSCTIAATRTDSATSSFDVYFDKLLLTNIDFDTLYKAEVIKADSVYCENPKFNLHVEITKKKGVAKSPPKLENIIKQLTGDLILENVVVSNADFNIVTVRDGVPNSFTFSKNNFEMEGLKIDQGAEKPLLVRRFAMAIRNYENFIKDSSYSIKFDSILFKDDRIYLSNFLLEQLNKGNIINTFRIPQFYLGGLSWDDLVFEKKLKADQAMMFNPTIVYTVNTEKKRVKNQNIFHSLGAINEFMDLNYLEIVEGNIDLTIKKDLKLKLKRANLSIQSNSLLSSKKIATIKSSLSSINFEKGILQSGNIDIELNNLRYIGESGYFVSDNISITNKNKNFELLAKNVAVEKMIVDELTGNIDAENINWKKGSVNLNLSNPDKEAAKSIFLLKKINGKNTSVNISKGDFKITTTIDLIKIDNLESRPATTIILNGLMTSGRQLKITNNTSALSIQDYQLLDNQNSTFLHTKFNSTTEKTSVDFSSSSIKLTPHIKQLLNGDINLDNIIINQPDIQLKFNPFINSPKSNMTKVKVNSIYMSQPKIDISINNKINTVFKWNGDIEPSNFLRLTDLSLNQQAERSTIIKEAEIKLSQFEFSSEKNQDFNSNNGEITATVHNINLSSPENLSFSWKGLINKLIAKDFYFDSIGKSGGTFWLKTAAINNLNISSTNTVDIKEFIAGNKEFQITQFTGNYKNQNNVIEWTNAGFNRPDNQFKLNSFTYSPTLPRDSFLAIQNFQKDYITYKSGPVTIKNIDPDLFFTNNLVQATSIDIQDAILKDYKDKQIPFKAGIIKPLPVSLLKKIPFQLLVESLAINNGEVEYTETAANAKTHGIIPITRMKINFKNIKNFNFLPNDTLIMDATGFLLDTAFAHLNIKESYNDSNGNFILKFQLSPVDLKITNPVLIPLGSAKLEAGILDTLVVFITGNETLATGEMKLLYHDLKIQLLKNGVPQKLKSFLANTFIINKNNTSRTGQVFFIRNKDRSAINYYVKSIGSGVASSIGAKNNKKLIKKYKKKQRNK